MPAAYLLSSRLQNTKFLAAFLFGSVAPDLDMLLFYFWDSGRVHHHEYLTHRPMLWIGVLLFALCIQRFTFGKILGWFAGGTLVHLVLDTTLGTINWGWPLFTWGGPFITVPATQSHWILSFALHWTFLIEVTICAAALWIFIKRRRA
jgi:inner membrane protein